jgi:hypothetical protein
MSVENKIREMMTQKLDEAFPGMGRNKEDKAPSQGSSKTPEVEMMHKGAYNSEGPKATASLSAGSGPKENAAMKQGSSQDATIDLETDQSNQGKAQSAKKAKAPYTTNKGPGAAPNFSNTTDPQSVINQPSSKGNVHREETEFDEDEYMSDEELTEYIESLSEEELDEFLEQLDEENEDDDMIVIDEETFNSLSEEEQAEFEEFDLDEVELDEGNAANKAKKNAYVQSRGEKAIDRDDLGGDGQGEHRRGTVFSKMGRMKDKAYTKNGLSLGNLSVMNNNTKKAGRLDLRKEAYEKEFWKSKGIGTGVHREDVNNLFASEVDLSEEFKEKAASLFEAVVTARVAYEVENLQDVLAEQAAEAVVAIHEDMVSKIDAYLSYVAEQWLAANEVAVETGLRTEVTEDFISGLKVLFAEHYIDVPSEKYNVMDEMQAEIDELTSQVNETVAAAVELNAELIEAKREVAFSRATSDLAQTEVEKLRGLVENVEFENEDLFEHKISVIKNSYFPKSTISSPITEEVIETQEISGTVAKYAELLSRNSF